MTQSIRNIAIIAHVDHGKTTSVNKIIQECESLDSRKNTNELILDNNDLEVNQVKAKQLTNMRKSGSDGAMRIAPKTQLSLEEAM
ncbi:GTP-binding protein [Flavobacteriales bacterium]|nr:GTP-binding protein [Flavobacteriales bacterium]